MKLLAGRPDPRRLETKSQEDLLQTRYVPWKEETPALEVMVSVLGKQITWVRKLDGEVCSAYVDKQTNLGKKYFRVYETKAGRRILEWQDREGFHAVGLDQVISVG